MEILKAHPYFEVAEENFFLLKKRHWLMDTLDGLARLNPSYKSEIDKIKVPDFSHFIKYYYSRNLPVVLTGGVDHWKAIKYWSPEYFQEKIGEQIIEVQCDRSKSTEFERKAGQYKTKMSMKEFVNKVNSVESSNDFYMTANNTKSSFEGVAKLYEDIGEFAKGYVQVDRINTQSFLWFGPKGTFTPLHHDLTNNMLIQIYGRKKISLISPLQVPYLYNDKGVFSDVFNPDDPAERAKFKLLQHTTKLECVLEPGDAIFIPIGWWHYVESLDTSISITFNNFNADNGYSKGFVR